MRSILDAEKHGHVLTVGADGQPWFKERTPNDGFPLWVPLGNPSFDPATISTQADQNPGDVWAVISVCGAAHADGRIDVVGTFSGPGESRDIFYRSRPAGDMVWAAWDRLEDNGFDGDIVAAVAGHDGLDVVTPVDLVNDQGFPEVDMSGRRCLPDGTWTSWTLLGRPQGGFTVDITPVLILGPGGLELFAVSATNVILIRCRRFPRRALALGGPLARARRPTRPPADQPGSPSHRTGAAHSRLPCSPLSCSRPPQQTIPAARPYTR